MTSLPPSAQTSEKPTAVAEKPGLESMLGLGELAARINASKLWLVLGGLSLAITVLGYRIGDRYGLVVAFFIALAFDALVFFYDDWRLLNQFPSEEIEGADAWGLNSLSKNLAKRLNFPPPTLREVESDTPFLFGAGLFQSRLKIFVSSSLARKLTSEEMSALLTYEIIRSKKGLTRTVTAAAAVADLFLVGTGTIDAVFCLRLFLRRKLHRAYFGPVTWASMPLVTLFLRLVIRRSAQEAVENETADAVGNNLAFVQALMKLDSYAKTLPIDASLAEATLFAVDPLSSYHWSSWTSVFPPVEARVRRLTDRFSL